MKRDERIPSYEETRDYLREHYTAVYLEEPFRRGYDAVTLTTKAYWNAVNGKQRKRIRLAQANTSGYGFTQMIYAWPC